MQIPLINKIKIFSLWYSDKKLVPTAEAFPRVLKEMGFNDREAAKLTRKKHIDERYFNPQDFVWAIYQTDDEPELIEEIPNAGFREVQSEKKGI
jgi:hypothetical protein